MALVIAYPCGDHFDGAHLYRPLGADTRFFGGNAEGFGCDLIPDVDGAGGPFRISIRGVFAHNCPILSGQSAVNPDFLNIQIIQVVKQHHICAFSRGDAPQLVIHLETLGAVDGHHLDGGKDVDAFFHRPADNMIQMSLGQEGVGMGVVGDQTCKAGVHFIFRDASGHLFQIMPCGALAEHGVHAKTHFGKGVLCPGGFVAAADAGGGVGI